MRKRYYHLASVCRGHWHVQTEMLLLSAGSTDTQCCPPLSAHVRKYRVVPGGLCIKDVIFGPKVGLIITNGTNLGVLKIRFQYILACWS